MMIRTDAKAVHSERMTPLPQTVQGTPFYIVFSEKEARVRFLTKIMRKVPEPLRCLDF